MYYNERIALPNVNNIKRSLLTSNRGIVPIYSDLRRISDDWYKCVLTLYSIGSMTGHITYCPGRQWMRFSIMLLVYLFQLLLETNNTRANRFVVGIITSSMSGTTQAWAARVSLGYKSTHVYVSTFFGWAISNLYQHKASATLYRERCVFFENTYSTHLTVSVSVNFASFASNQTFMASSLFGICRYSHRFTH